jgi:hypothetical protein
MKLTPSFDKVFWLLLGSLVVPSAFCVESALLGTLPRAFGLKIAAVAFSLTGTLFLAVRASGIQEASALVARVHEKNLEQAADSGPNQLIYTRATKHLERAKASGVKFLVVGWILLVLAAALSCYAFYLEIPVRKIADQGDPANWSQPIRSETNSTSPAAGSRR